MVKQVSYLNLSVNHVQSGPENGIVPWTMSCQSLNRDIQLHPLTNTVFDFSADGETFRCYVVCVTKPKAKKKMRKGGV